MHEFVVLVVQQGNIMVVNNFNHIVPRDGFQFVTESKLPSGEKNSFKNEVIH